MPTTPTIIERKVTQYRLRGVISRGDATEESYLDKQPTLTDLNFSGLSGYHEWVIEAEFEGGYTAAIVTCNWRGGACFIARAEHHFWPDTEERIESHGHIIPYVKNWLNRLWKAQVLYGVLRVGDAVDCPHLEIFGRSA